MGELISNSIHYCRGEPAVITYRLEHEQPIEKGWYYAQYSRTTNKEIQPVEVVTNILNGSLQTNCSFAKFLNDWRWFGPVTPCKEA